MLLTCQHRSLRLWVLACFVFALLVAAASPALHPRAMELVCSGTGAAKWVVQTPDGVAPADAASLDCPLCLPADAPPPLVAAMASPHPAPLIYATWHRQPLPPPPSHHRPPARAPPVFS